MRLTSIWVLVAGCSDYGVVEPVQVTANIGDAVAIHDVWGHTIETRLSSGVRLTFENPPDRAAVTLFRGREVTTVFGVEPGASLDFREPQPRPRVHVAIAFPPLEDGYPTFHAPGCEIDVQGFGTCPAETRRVVAYAHENATGGRVGYAVVALDETNTGRIPTIDAWRYDFARMEITAKNMPANASLIRAEVSIEDGGARYDSVATHVPGIISIAPFGDTLTVRTIVAASIGDMIVHERIDRVPVRSTRVIADFEDIPQVDGIYRDGGGRPTILWHGDPGDAKAAVACAAWGSDVAHWCGIADPQVTMMVTMPEVPSSIVPNAPPLSSGVKLIEIDGIASYDEVRSAPFRVLGAATASSRMGAELSRF